MTKIFEPNECAAHCSRRRKKKRLREKKFNIYVFTLVLQFQSRKKHIMKFLQKFIHFYLLITTLFAIFSISKAAIIFNKPSRSVAKTEIIDTVLIIAQTSKYDNLKCKTDRVWISKLHRCMKLVNF